VLHSWPPTTNTRPSASTVCPAQKMSVTPAGSGIGTGVKMPVAGSQTRADSEPWQRFHPPSHMRILPLYNCTILIATRGQFITDDHWQITAGSLALTTFTVIALESVLLAAASRARAASVCVPLAAPEESQENVYGAVMSSAPTGTPSTRNWTPTTPML